MTDNTIVLDAMKAFYNNLGLYHKNRLTISEMRDLTEKTRNLLKTQKHDLYFCGGQWEATYSGPLNANGLLEG